MVTFERNYSIKFEYTKQIKDPVKLFLNYSKIIDSIKISDIMLAKTINRQVHYSQYLISIENGSFISSIKSLFEYEESESIDNLDDINDENVNNYLSAGNQAIINELESGQINSEKQITKIRDEINEAAKKNKISNNFNYSPPTIPEIIDVTKSFSDATQEFSDDEKISIIDKNEKIFVIPNNVKVDVSKIEEELIKKFITTNRQLILKIKKPDYLGDAKWEFKHGNNRIDAKISDKKWLTQFHEKNIPLTPGDSLEVEVQITEEYDKYGNLFKNDYNILRIIDVIKGKIDE